MKKLMLGIVLLFSGVSVAYATPYSDKVIKECETMSPYAKLADAQNTQ